MSWRDFLKSEFNFESQTTFWEDFYIADKFGTGAVRGTFRKCLAYAKIDYKYLTELSLVLNHRLWMHYDKENMTLVGVYDEIWRKCDNYAKKHLKGNELMFYLQVTD